MMENPRILVMAPSILLCGLIYTELCRNVKNGFFIDAIDISIRDLLFHCFRMGGNNENLFVFKVLVIRILGKVHEIIRFDRLCIDFLLCRHGSVDIIIILFCLKVHTTAPCP